jgi:hypothetical protein
MDHAFAALPKKYLPNHGRKDKPPGAFSQLCAPHLVYSHSE